ncbi:hypothetical protein QTO34_007843 [Cnephaeus nilssonii]|uniref:Uncharacterized protein n=1 Tax=Cnephaeus nilssonii TaxID=3371016 RepID=A0AA40HJU0_CNENI|nr:hypothetical protein QTO34_007843 [Eptesicus nilssonii]
MKTNLYNYTDCFSAPKREDVKRRRELSVCAMAVLQLRRGLWGSEPTSCRGPSKAGELGACPLRHQAFQKPPLRQRLLKGLVHQRTDTQLHRRAAAPLSQHRGRGHELVGAAAAAVAAAADSAQRLSVKEETIFLRDGPTRVTDLAQLPTEILGAPETANTDLENS